MWSNELFVFEQERVVSTGAYDPYIFSGIDHTLHEQVVLRTDSHHRTREWWHGTFVEREEDFQGWFALLRVHDFLECSSCRDCPGWIWAGHHDLLELVDRVQFAWPSDQGSENRTRGSQDGLDGYPESDTGALQAADERHFGEQLGSAFGHAARDLCTHGVADGYRAVGNTSQPLCAVVDVFVERVAFVMQYYDVEVVIEVFDDMLEEPAGVTLGFISPCAREEHQRRFQMIRHLVSSSAFS